MTSEKQRSWVDFVAFVKKQCNQVEYTNWIAPIECLACEKEGVTLATPNIFVQQYLLDNYQEALTAFLPVDDKGNPLITFVVRTAQPKRPTQSAAVTSRLAPTASQSTSKLNQLYTFENFIEGPSNRFIKSAAVGVAAKPGTSYNPLFIHGGVGLGKTHLLHAISHYSYQQRSKLNIQCISTEGFINDLVAHLQTMSVGKMKQLYRNLDMFMVDDIQFLEHRLNFEEEFCNTFESLINQGKQIVLTSDKAPGSLKLSERIIARMQGGLVARMMVPDLETRVAILQVKADKKGLNLSPELAFYIAENIHNNVRQLEGAINRLAAYCRLMQFDVTRQVVDETLGEMFQQPTGAAPSIDDIIQTASAMYQVQVADLYGKGRTKQIAFARQVAMYLAKEFLGDSLAKIATSFGGRTHSTLFHAWKKITSLAKSDDTLRHQIAFMRQQLHHSVK